jgi:glycine/D-amino acid oxidase-like deaminating enzyme
MPIRNLPYWLDRFPKSRRPSYPRLQGNLETTVAIVGGGLTGCTCAWSFAAAGVKVVLLEAEAIGGGATARGSGLVREDFDASFQETAGLHGLRSARALWQAMRRASLDYPAAIRRLQIRCDLAPSDLLDHSWVTPAMLARQAGVEGGAAIRTRGAVLDPYRACVAFAAAATDRGAVLHAKSPVRRVRAGRKQVEIATDAGTVRADSVIIATGAPLADLRALRRHVKARHGYAVVTGSLPASVRREVGTRAAAMRDSNVPPHFLRWLREDRVMFSGADQPEVAPRASDKVLVQRTGQLMYELSTLYPAVSGVQADWAWDFTHYETVDRLPFVGPHRNFPRHLFAMGAGRHGAGFAWLAARVLLRQHQGEPARGDELFGFTRIL